MSDISFLETVLWMEGHYCLFVANPSTGKKFQKFYKAISELQSAAQGYDKQGFDCYFALGTLAEPGTRTADNVVWMRSFFLDLDCGEEKAQQDKGYPTQTSALYALKIFCQKHQLPKPVLVSSGYGIHAYWPLEEPVARDEWIVLAGRFKKMCRAANLKFDPAVPADCARVLRIPGTHNHKSDNRRPVTVLGDNLVVYPLAQIQASIEEHAEDFDPMPMKASKGRFVDDPLMEALTGNLTSRFKAILEKTTKGRGCAQIGHAVSNQAELEEPLWRAALSIAAQCVDHEKAIHIISKGYPDYDPEETERKAYLTKGPYLCKSFEDINPAACEGCPHRGKISSPIQLGREVMEASDEDNIIFDRPEKISAAELQQYTIPKYPSPYFRGKNGGIYLETENKAGDPVDVCIYHHDLYVVSRVTDQENGDGVIMRLHLPYDGVREFNVPLTAVTSKDEFRKHLSKHGVATANKVDALMDYTIKWINKLEYISAADNSRRQFGWIDYELNAFALGRTLILADRFEVNPPSNTTSPLFDMFEPRGTLARWKELMQFFARPGMEPYQYTMGVGFGSILMAMTPINGVVYHMHSKLSGIGKTTSMYAAASAWAHPTRYVMHERDTQNSKMFRAEVMKNLPLFLDEMTNIEPKDASDLLYQMPAGMQRSRMTQGNNAERFRGEPWQLICVSTGNTSLIDRISVYKDAPKAELQRVLEVNPTKFIFGTKEETDAFSEELTRNYGHAGILFVQHVIRNRDSVKAMLKKVQNEIDKHANLEAENRFWSVQAACAVTSLMICKKIGLLDYDINNFAKWVVSSMKMAKGMDVVMSDDCLELVSEYIYEHYDKFLRLSSRDTGEGNEELHHVAIPLATPKQQLVGRHETDVNKWYLLPKPLKHWCLKKHISYNWLLMELKRSPARAHTIKFRMGRGTKVNLPPVNAISLNGEGWMSEEVLKSFEQSREASAFTAEQD